jgi:hypothetical protein
LEVRRKVLLLLGVWPQSSGLYFVCMHPVVYLFGKFGSVNTTK